jgi:hypothetical protein
MCHDEGRKVGLEEGCGCKGACKRNVILPGLKKWLNIVEKVPMVNLFGYLLSPVQDLKLNFG